jgi:glycyl-tRNA synthetase beta chain
VSGRTGAGGTFLLEIGTEEIPARMLDGALRDLGRRIFEAAVEEGILPAGTLPEAALAAFGTPRRLAVRITGLLPRQPDREVEVTGPPASAAFDARGLPTRAAEGFARAQGAAVGDLRRTRTPKGEVVTLRRTVGGRPAAEVLGRLVPPAVQSLPFPKSMRWGSGEHQFVRPIHTVVALLDGEIVALSLAGIAAGRETSGHRVLGGTRFALPDPTGYVETLRRHHVLVDPAERRAAIERLLREGARAAGGRLAAPPGSPPGAEGDPALVDEVTNMIEWPHVITGTFDADFLRLPPEIPITAMRHHQRFFALRDADGALLNRFLAVANMTGDPAGAVRRGNEWVLRARLTDARFFWEEDRKTTLQDHAAGLARVTFHEKLGSYADKAERLARLAERLIQAFAAAGHRPDPRAVDEAARLCKADLTTLMVGEFPELEGIVGALYARADGRPAAVAEAIYGHTLPRGPADPLPPTVEGAIVSLADRLDTQAGFFGIGVVPTGSRDPYGLRRSVQGVCRILIERRVPVALGDLLAAAIDGYGGMPRDATPPDPQAAVVLADFYRGRLQHLAEAAGIRADSARAALAAGADDPHAARARMEALDALRHEPAFLTLATAHKRIKNIVRDQPPGRLDPSALRDEAERLLLKAIEAAGPAIEAAAKRRDPPGALRALARVAPSLDRFFTEVMVMTEDPAARGNRVALLRRLGDLFLRLADFSEIVVDGEPAAPSRPPTAAAAATEE